MPGDQDRRIGLEDQKVIGATERKRCARCGSPFDSYGDEFILCDSCFAHKMLKLKTKPKDQKQKEDFQSRAAGDERIT